MVKVKKKSDKDDRGEKWYFLRRLFFNNSILKLAFSERKKKLSG